MSEGLDGIMDEGELVVSAEKIDEPSRDAVEEFSERKDELAVMLKDRMERRDDLEDLIGEGNRPMMEDNSENMVDFLHSIFTKYKPEVFVETVLWVFKTYRSHGFNPGFWPANLNTFVEIMDEELSDESFEELNPFLQWIIENIPVFIEMTDEHQK